MTRFNANAGRKYNYPYIEADEYFPNVYTVAMLAYSQSWRTDENIRMLAEAFNHINDIMKPYSTIFFQKIYFDWQILPRNQQAQSRLLRRCFPLLFRGR